MGDRHRHHWVHHSPLPVHERRSLPILRGVEGQSDWEVEGGVQEVLPHTTLSNSLCLDHHVGNVRPLHGYRRLGGQGTHRFLSLIQFPSVEVFKLDGVLF